MGSAPPRILPKILALAGDRLSGPIAQGAAATFTLKTFHTVLRIVISFGLARSLGPAGYGAYSFALACIGVLNVFAMFGFNSVLVRDVASYQARSQWPLLHGLLQRSRHLPAMFSVGLALAAAGVVWAMSGNMERSTVTTLWIAMLVLPFLTMAGITQSVMMGFHRVVLAQVPMALVQPLFFLILLGVSAALLEASLDAAFVIALFGLSVMVALGAALKFAHGVKAGHLQKAMPEYATAAWLRSAARFAVISGLNVLGASLGVLMLGLMAGPEATGIFGLANAAAALVALPLMAVNAPLAPAVSAIFSDGNKAKLQQLATKAARSALLFSLPLAVVFALFGDGILSLFGSGFTAGYTALVILSAAQVVNAGAGSVGVLLQMTGNERDVGRGLALALAVNFIINLVLIPLWGVNGAAMGAAANLIATNVWFAIRVRTRLGIRPTAIG